MQRHTYKSIGAVALAACLTVVLIDRVLNHFAPITHRREVQEGMQDLAQFDPEILVLGSSHGRTFHVLGEELLRRSQGAHRLVSVPLENGKLSSYAWLLDHKIEPLFTGPNPSAQRKRAALKRFIILTEWWDSYRNTAEGWNLPSRAWTFDDYLTDVLPNGVNDYNRNYLQNRWRRLFWESSLVQDRGFSVLLKRVKATFTHASLQMGQADYEDRLNSWRSMIEGGVDRLGDPAEMAALARLIDFGKRLDADTTVVLFPRKPDTLTDKAKATTLKIFREKVEALALPRGASVIDLTFSTPLESTDFMDDFDHVSASGNQKFAQWALSGPLAFLLEGSRTADRGVNP